MVASSATTLRDALGSPRIVSGPPRSLHLDLPCLINEQDEPLRLLASWLLDEHEGAVFYAGSGGAVRAHIPPHAIGFRLRRWPSEGLAPEYLDWRFA
ncbi:MAG: hypothetical protein AB7R89_27350 [Dehalococcoidia bacterium]